MIHRVAFVLIIACATPLSAHASDWAYGMFNGGLDHDFGRVPRGTTVTHQFPFQNNTGREVRIRRVNASCGCVTATVSTMKLAPGETAFVDASMATTGFQGSKSVTIFVQFDRPRRSQVALRVSAVIVGNLISGNNEMDFGVVTAGSPAEKKMNLDYTGKVDWKVTGLDFPADKLSAEVEEVSRKGSDIRYDLKVQLRDHPPIGRFEERVVVKTNDEQAPEITVLVKATIEPKITVSPESIKYEELTAGQEITKNVIVKSSKPFKVIRVENTNGLFKIRSATTSRTTQLVVVTMVVPANVSEIPDHIDIVTDLEDDHVLSVAIQK